MGKACHLDSTGLGFWESFSQSFKAPMRRKCGVYCVKQMRGSFYLPVTHHHHREPWNSLDKLVQDTLPQPDLCCREQSLVYHLEPTGGKVGHNPTSWDDLQRLKASPNFSTTSISQKEIQENYGLNLIGIPTRIDLNQMDLQMCWLTVILRCWSSWD